MPIWSRQTWNQVLWDKTSGIDFTAVPCNGEAVNVRLLQVVGGGHTWPGHLIMLLPASMVGATSLEFSASDEIVEFFAAAS
jgi:poly(3-hydroxybutyrate) depolymerase